MTDLSEDERGNLEKLLVRSEGELEDDQIPDTEKKHYKGRIAGAKYITDTNNDFIDVHEKKKAVYNRYETLFTSIIKPPNLSKYNNWLHRKARYYEGWLDAYFVSKGAGLNEIPDSRINSYLEGENPPVVTCLKNRSHPVRKIFFGIPCLFGIHSWGRVKAGNAMTISGEKKENGEWEHNVDKQTSRTISQTCEFCNRYRTQDSLDWSEIAASQVLNKDPQDIREEN